MPVKNEAQLKDPKIPPALLTVKQAAESLNVSQSLMYRWLDERRLPYVDLGQEGKRRCVRFRPEDLERFIHDHSRN